MSGTKDTTDDSGSGIFSGRNGARIESIIIDDTTKLMIGDLEKDPQRMLFIIFIIYT